MNKDFTYKKDTIIGTWVAISLLLGSAFGVLIHFDVLTDGYEPPAPECDVCRWIEPTD